MSSAVAVRPAVRRARLSGVPWWVRITAMWAGSRALTTAIMVALATREPRTFWARPHPSYLRLAQFWDSGWFHTVATTGYPRVLPVGRTGHLLPNAWAFLPAYPAVVTGVTAVTRLPWDVASVLVSLACSLGGALVLDRLLQAVLGRRSPFAVLLFCCLPVAPLDQVAYAESTTVLLLALLLLLLVRRRYVASLPVIAAVALTRPVGVPVAALIAAHLALRLLRRRTEPMPARSIVSCVAALLVAVAAAAAWPVVAALVTGDPSAYVKSELAWRHGMSFVPVLPWLTAARRIGGPILGPAVLVLVVVAFAALVAFAPAVTRLGADIRIWCAVYAGYLLVVFAPQSSTIRLLLPLFPLVGAAAGIRSKALKALLLTASVVLQAAWFAWTWLKLPAPGWAPP